MDFNPFGFLDSFFGEAGGFMSSFSNWVDRATKASEMDVVGAITILLAVIVIILSIYGMMKEKQKSMRR